MSGIKYGILHCHTDNSIRDSVMTVEALVTQAKKMGAPAVALTDHGVMTGYMEFMKLCRKEGINPIVGVEAYVEEDVEGCRHLILMAKDYTGFQALIKAVSESNTRIAKVDGASCPRMNKDILARHFGPSSKGHGHVIATSSCMKGVLAALVTAKMETEKKVETLRRKQKQYESPKSAGFIKNLKAIENLNSRQKQLEGEIVKLDRIASRTLKVLEYRMQETLAGSDEWNLARKNLEAAQQENETARSDLNAKKREKRNVNDEIERLNPVIQQQKASVTKWEQLQSQIDETMKGCMADETMDQVLKQEACWYRDNFGRDDFYIELQYHGTREEKQVMTKLAWLSDLTNIPVCLSNNAHMPTKSKNDILARTIIHTTIDDKWKEPSVAEKEKYLKTDKELIGKLAEILPKEKVREGYENVGKIVSQCDLIIPVKNHYPIFHTPDGSTAGEYLRKRAYEGVSWRYPDGSFQDYERLEQELNVICSMGYADYHCIVEDFLRYARAAGRLDLKNPEQKKLALSFDTEKIEQFVKNMPGEAVGPGRGSSAGSLVCYLIGITNIDPLKYGLLFERFLNPERISMPDIDCDIETDIRPYVIRYVKQKYGSDCVCGIMTRRKQTGKAAIQTAGRVYGIQMKNDSTAFSKLSSVVSKKAVEFSEDELYINLKSIRKQLEEEFKGNTSAMEIIRYAMLIEGTMSQIGQHAAGIIITDGQPVDEYVPLIYNSGNDIMMTQCDMNQAEEFHLLKIDFLSLNNLTIITETVREIYERTGKAIDIDQIPLNDSTVFSAIYSKGKTNSIFQFQSQGMKRMLKSFKPDNIFDLILLVAMYRPGPMQYLTDMVKTKQGKRSIHFKVSQLEPILKDTYGGIAYQEQVQEIFKLAAGYSLGQADLVRRAMSKKSEEILEKERNTFIYGDRKRNIPGCVSNGITETDANVLFNQLKEFGRYAFNKSHATCYAILSYQTAWLKYHYPMEYMKAVLNHTAFEKVPGVVMDLENMGIRVHAPDINGSEYGFRILDGEVWFGLGSIKGVGEAAVAVIEERKKNGEFRSLQDFILRIQPTKNILESFICSGAMDSFCENRKAMKEAVPEYLKLLKKMKEYGKKLGENEEKGRREGCRQKYLDIMEKIRDTKPDIDICENALERLLIEKNILGVFASRHPMSLFPDIKECGAMEIAKIQKYPQGKIITITGIVSEFYVCRRKQDGAEMGFFNLSDETGEVDVCCFAKAYEKARKILKEDVVIKITGTVMYDKSDDAKKIAVVHVELLRTVEKVITVYTKLYLAGVDKEHGELWNLLKPYVSKEGNPVKLYDLLMDEFRETDLRLSPEVIHDERIRGNII